MCARLDALGEEIEALEAAGIDGFHVDVMDGHFVPNLAFGPSTVAALRGRTRRPLEIHLMVREPERWFDGLAEAGADLVFFHLETVPDPVATARALVDRGVRAGVALGPRASLPASDEPAASRLRSLVGDVIVMGVEPGFAGGAWLADTAERIRAAVGWFRGCRIHLDGHVDATTGRLARAAGASAFVCGTASLFAGSAAGYADRLAALRRSLATSAPTVVAFRARRRLAEARPT
jgi:ribulose-phosphate 3-epimerase